MNRIQGQLLRLTARREVAIYLREGTLWIADFIDGDGEIVDAVTWFRFNCGATRHVRRRMLRESAIPLSPELAARIERLHRTARAPLADRRPTIRFVRRLFGRWSVQGDASALTGATADSADFHEPGGRRSLRGSHDAERPCIEEYGR